MDAAARAFDVKLVGFDAGRARQKDEAGFAIRRSALVSLARLKPHDLKSDMAPTSGLRAYLQHRAVGCGRMRANPKSHAASFSPEEAACARNALRPIWA